MRASSVSTVNIHGNDSHCLILCSVIDSFRFQSSPSCSASHHVLLLVTILFCQTSVWQQINKEGGGGGDDGGSGSNIKLIKTQILGKFNQNTNLKINQGTKS